MAETLPSFVMRRRPDWDRLQGLLEQQARVALGLSDLRQLDRLYRRATADLARAQAVYSGTDAHRYLNQLCARAYEQIYQPPKERWAAVQEFYRRGFPQAVRTQLRYVGASGILFALGLLLGALMVAVVPEGALLLVPRGIQDAVAARRMWTDDLLTVMPPNVASSAILTNNLTVTIAAFALGATWGIGTALVLLVNGLQLGAVGALCAREQMLDRLLDFIAAHGPVEVSTILIAGAAGLMLGHALVDPGELPRSLQLRRRAREGVQLVVGCAPFLALIGVVEGFISPGTLFPTALKAALGTCLAGLFWGYLLLGARRGAP